MRGLLLLAAMTVATPAHADLRDLCADRPGLGTPACTMDPGHAIVELGLIDWTHDRQSDALTDTILSGDVLIRVGLNETTEAQVGWTAYGHVRTRDAATGIVSQASGVSDVLLGLRKSISGPNGAVAIQAFVTLPTGDDAVGAGDWGAGILMPFGFDLGRGASLNLTPEIDAAVDQDGSGRHLTFGGVIGVSEPLTKSLTATAELSAFKDNDPGGDSTSEFGSISLAWQRGANTQFDFGVVAGLDGASPGLEFYAGISRRF